MGQDYINNGVSTTNTAAGELYFGHNVASDQLWFDRVDGSGNISSTGNNLRITVMGTNTQITINNEFNSSDAYAQLSDIQLSDSGLQLGAAQISNLVSAMATFETNYYAAYSADFDPTNSGNTTVTDSTVLSAVNDDWLLPTITSSVSYTLPSDGSNLTLIGSANITGTGNTLANIITGNTGNDVLNDGGAGASDTLIGNSSAGADTFVVNNTGDSITETNSGTVALVESSVNWTLGTNLENLTLSGSSSLTGTGNTLANIITGNTGNDVLIAGTGMATLIGDSSAGADTFLVNNTGDSVTETNSGTAALVESSVNWTLGTHLENLTLSGTANLTGIGNTLANVITGNTGNDVLNDGGAGGSDTLIGNSSTGADTFVVNNTGDSVTETHSGGTALVESIVNWTLGTNTSALTLEGTAALAATGTLTVADGSDVLTDNNFTNGQFGITVNSGDVVTGGSGDDTLSDAGAGNGNYTLIGNSTNGGDEFIVNNTGDSVTEAVGGGAALVVSGVNWTLGTHTDHLTLTGTAALTGTGNTDADVLTGNTGADTLIGNNSSGNDTFVVDNTGDSVTETNSGTTALVKSSVNWTLGSHLEDLALTGSSSLSGTGNSLADIITGNTGNDVLTAGSGVATLIGDSASGADTFVVNNTGDSVTETNSGTAGLVNSSVNWTLGANLENLTLTGGSNLSGTGNSLTDIITGNTGNDILTAGAGVATLIGNSASGDDTFVVDNTGDSVTETNGGTAGLVKSSVNWTLGVNLENLTLTGSSNLSGTGNSLTDIITGNTGNDILTAGAGVDTLIGNSTAGADTFVVNNTGDSVSETNGGGAALIDSGVSYTLVMNVNQLTLTGTGNISGTGNSAADVITGNTGNDVLTAGTGVATLIGNSSTGADTFVVNNTGDSVTETNSGTAATVLASVSYTLGTNVENLTLIGSGNIHGTGNASNDIITANTGNDVITAGAGADTLIAGATGNDTFVVNSTSDVVTGNVSGGTDLLESSASFTLGAYLNNLTLTGSGNLTGTGNTLANIITGNTGNDVLGDGGTGGNDTLIGDSASGTDTFVINNSGDIVSETNTSGAALILSGVSFDLATNSANVNNLTLTGSANLTGTGNAVTDAITGNTGNDVLVSGSNTDTLIGNSTAGDDTFILNNSGDSVMEANSGTTATVEAGFSYTLGANLENLTLTGSVNLSGTGNSLTDTITGNTGNDVLIAGTGMATLIGNSSSGADTFVVNNTGDSVTETTSGTAGLVESSVSWTLGTHFEALALTGSSALEGVGNTGNDVLTSNTGTDTLVGNSTSGADTFVVSNTGDSVTETNSGTLATVDSSVSYTLGTNLENLTLMGSGNLSGTGNSLTNIITGNTGNDVLTAGSGVATLIGNSASGADTFVVNNTSDSVTETNSGTEALVESSVSYTLGTNVTNLTLTGSGNLTGTANNANDVLTANNGADVLVAGTGDDTFTGGTGADTFIIGTSGNHVVTNYSYSKGDVVAFTDTTLTEGTIETTRVGNDLELTDPDPSTVTLSGFFTGFSGSTEDVEVQFATGGPVTLAINSAGEIVSGTLITGGSGNATLSDDGAGNGNYTLIGNSTDGGDEFIVNNTGDSVTETNAGTTATVVASVSWTLGTHLEDLTLTGSSSLVGTGNTGSDILTGNTGADTLIGNSTAGNDTFILNNTGDSVTETNSGSAALVEAGFSYTLGTHLEDLTLTGSSSLVGTGNTGNDILTSNTGADTLIGNSSSGADTFVVNNTGDSLSETNSGTAATVDSSVNWTLGTHLEKLTLTGSANLTGTGNSAAAIITGNTGNDFLSAGTSTGADTLIGNSASGADTFVVNNTGDSITEANSGTAALVESSISFTLGTHLEDLTLTGSSALKGVGNSGTDILTSNTGADTLVGNSTNGNDTFVVSNTSDSVTEANAGTAALVISSVSYTLGTNIEELTLTGSSSLKGVGNSSTDILSDGTGAAADTLVGESSNGSDTFIVNNTGDTVSEAHYSTNTALVESSVSFTLVSNVDDLTFTGTASVKATGNYATDILISNTGADTLVGNSLIGTDTFVVNNTADSVTENYSGSTALVDSSVSFTIGAHIEGLTLTASGLKGTGNTGNDVLSDSGTGADTLVGDSSSGADTFIVNNTGDSITETNSGTAALVEASFSYTLGTHLEKLTLEGTSNLTGTGNSVTDTITGNTGNDVLIASSGVATLIGDSTAGADTFVVDSTSDSVTETNSGTEALVESSASFTLGTHIEELILTGSSSLKGVGNSGTDTLSDGTGTYADTLVGESSNGSDTFIVNNTGDTVSEAHYSTNTALVESSVSFTLVSNVDDLTFTGTAAVKATGNYATDILTSNTGADTLVGNSLIGTDTFIVNNTGDSVTENYSGSTALVDSSVSFTIGTHIEGLTLTGSGIIGTLNNSTDTITDDSASGGDTLVGGTGADDFVLASAGVYNSIDVLNNFSTAHSDKIDISALMAAAGYHSGTSTLADFVQAVNSGSNSELQIDQTGTGSHFQTVATIAGVTSINVATYVSNGNLVV